MNINYWECNFQDCDSYYAGEEEGEVYIYQCTHPDNKDKMCELDNKWGSDCEDCPLLNDISKTSST